MHSFEGREHLLQLCGASCIYGAVASQPQEIVNPTSQASHITVRPWRPAASSGGRKSTELLDQLGADLRRRHELCSNRRLECADLINIRQLEPKLRIGLLIDFNQIAIKKINDSFVLRPYPSRQTPASHLVPAWLHGSRGNALSKYRGGSRNHWPTTSRGEMVAARSGLFLMQRCLFVSIW